MNMTSHLVTSSVLLAMLSAPALAQESVETPHGPIVITHGEAIVRRAPDQARVHLSVETRAQNPKTAASENAKVMTAIQQRMRSLGIDAEAMQTRAYELHQEFDYVDGKQVPRGYLARNTIEVRVDQIDRAGEIIDAGVAAGATSVGSIEFDLKDRESVERDALRRAVADARERASAAASGAGLTAGRILKIEEGAGTITPPPIPFARSMAMQREAAVDTPVASGQIEVRATVTLTTELK